jgi:Tol biopolymer transport system component
MSFNFNQDPQKYDMAFTKNGDGIYVINFENGKEKKIVIDYVSDFSLSPDGKKLVYTKVTEDCGRSIYITDLNDLKEQKLNINNCNAYSPTWSPDNKFIAFNIWTNNDWHIGIINADNSNLKVLKCVSSGNLPTWSHDGKSIITYDFSQIRKIDLTDRIVETFSIKSIPNNYGSSTFTKFFYSSDNNFLIWNGTTEEKQTSTLNPHDPIEGIMVYDFLQKTKYQISPKGMHICNPFVDSADNIYFDGKIINKDSKIDNESTNIYMINLNERILKLVTKNASSPSLRISN